MTPPTTRHWLAIVATCSLVATPAALAADTMFISDFATGDIVRFDLPSTTGTTIVSGLPAPEDGACSPTTGLIYFAESNFDLLDRWDQNGFGATNIIPAAGAVPGPEGLSFNTAGDLFFNTRERVVTNGAWMVAGGNPLNPAVQIAAPFTGFGEGSEIVLAGPHTGALLLVARAEQKVFKSEPPGAALTDFIPAIAFPANSKLYGIATNGCGEVYVAFGPVSVGPSEVYRFDPDGNFIESYASGFLLASYLEFDSDGNLYVTDSDSGEIYKVAPDKTKAVFATMFAPLGVAICRERPVPTCGVLTCNAGGPYQAECGGVRTCVKLDGSLSNDSNGRPITFAWSSDCPAATFDDPTKVDPELCMDSKAPCPLDCTAFLTVANGSQTASCSAPVRVQDTLPPTLTGCALKPAAAPGPASSATSKAPRRANIPPAPPRAPRSPASPASACSGPTSALIEVVCGLADDACDANPTVEARMVLTTTDPATCLPVTTEENVSCGQIVEVRRLPKPCLALPRPPASPRSDGIKILEGEDIRLEVKATDHCGIVSAACTAEAKLCPPAPPKCPASRCR